MKENHGKTSENVAATELGPDNVLRMTMFPYYASHNINIKHTAVVQRKEIISIGVGKKTKIVSCDVNPVIFPCNVYPYDQNINTVPLVHVSRSCSLNEPK